MLFAMRLISHWYAKHNIERHDLLESFRIPEASIERYCTLLIRWQIQ